MTEMQQGLLIAGIGMGLVFIVIVFLWGLMALMMRLTSGKQADDEAVLPEATDAPLLLELEVVEEQRKAAAAAVAVASALAQTKRRLASVASPSAGEAAGGMTPWLVAHRTRQIEQKNSRG